MSAYAIVPWGYSAPGSGPIGSALTDALRAAGAAPERHRRALGLVPGDRVDLNVAGVLVDLRRRRLRGRLGRRGGGGLRLRHRAGLRRAGGDAGELDELLGERPNVGRARDR